MKRIKISDKINNNTIIKSNINLYLGFWDKQSSSAMLTDAKFDLVCVHHYPLPKQILQQNYRQWNDKLSLF